MQRVETNLYARSSSDLATRSIAEIGCTTIARGATLAALLMRQDGAFITGRDFLMDGGVTASYFFSELAG
jgi:hypothetical protein